MVIYEGDAIAPGDILCDIQTDKAVVSFELEEEGILAKILVRHEKILKAVSTTGKTCLLEARRFCERMGPRHRKSGSLVVTFPDERGLSSTCSVYQRKDG